jgi:hypothetical protein
MENYEQKYKEALERAKYCLTTDMDNSGHWAVKHIFPELKVSEIWLEKQDERPKKNWGDAELEKQSEEKPIKVYRVENEAEQKGLWRKFDGTWQPLFDMLTDGKCKDMPMEDRPIYRKEGKRWFASAPSKEALQKWFSKIDLEELVSKGFTISEFEVVGYKKVSDFEYIFTRDNIISRNYLEVSDIYSEQKDFAPKVKSKFHEGDWIIHHGINNIYQVVAIIDNQYQLKYDDTYIIQYCVDVDKCAKLFKPKFNVDDWVVNNTTHNVCRILKVEHGQYICDNCSFPITKENEYHLWTIKDAKDRMATRLSQTKLQDEQKLKWSEQDKNKIEDIIYFLDTAKAHYASTEALDDCVDWLKSLKQRIEQ